MIDDDIFYKDVLRDFEQRFKNEENTEYKKFNVWLPIGKVQKSDILAYHAPHNTPVSKTTIIIWAPNKPVVETRIKIWVPIEYQEKYREGYKIFKKRKAEIEGETHDD